MEISKLISELQSIQSVYGDIEVQMQNGPDDEKIIWNIPDFYVVPEEYIPEDGGWTVNIRSWPY